MRTLKRTEGQGTLLRVGAVEFPKQRRNDLWEVGLDPVHSKVHSYCTKKLKDAGSLKEETSLELSPLNT